MLIALKEGKHGPTDGYTRTLRRKLNQQFPDASFQFLPADITTQILNFGLPAPIDIQVVGTRSGQLCHRAANRAEDEGRFPARWT